MRRGFLLTFLLVSNLASAQNAIVEEFGPPHEDLARAQEQISAVLCRAAFRKVEQLRFENEYALRIKAVHEKVSLEYGSEVANASYVLEV